MKALEWLAVLLTMAGTWRLSGRHRGGFLICTAGNVGWLAVGAVAGMWGLVVTNVFFILVNARGWRYWGRHPERRTT